MKKILSALLIAVMVFALAGCGETPSKDVDLTAIVTEINQSYPSSMTQIESAEKLESYYSVAPNDVESFAAEFDQSGIDEIILIKASSADAVSRIEKALTTRYNAKLQLGASYSPEELETIKSCSVETNGNYVSLIVSEEAQGMTEIYNKAFA